MPRGLGREGRIDENVCSSHRSLKLESAASELSGVREETASFLSEVRCWYQKHSRTLVAEQERVSAGILVGHEEKASCLNEAHNRYRVGYSRTLVAGSWERPLSVLSWGCYCCLGKKERERSNCNNTKEMLKRKRREIGTKGGLVSEVSSTEATNAEFIWTKNAVPQHQNTITQIEATSLSGR